MLALFWIAFGIGVWLSLVYAARRFGLVQRWKVAARVFGDGGVPWAKMRSVKALGEAGTHGLSNLMFVSRHDIAECGLTCPLCQTMVADRGDFTNVRRMLVNGQENEVIHCPGNRIVEDDRVVPCDAWLVASPDTEHGDHLDNDGKVVTTGENDDPDFYRFKRITADQALREKWGLDVAPLIDGETGMRIDPQTMTPVKSGTKNDVLAGDELLNALRQASLKEEAEKVITKPLDSDQTPVTRQPTIPGDINE